MPGGGTGILKKALYSYRGVSDALGTNSRIMCAALAALPDYDNQSVLILNGPCRGQCKDISGITTGGQVNISGTFDAVITADVSFLILAQKPATAEVADIKTQTDKLAGETPVSGSVTANWQSGAGTSGETGADLVTIGVNDTRYKLHSLLVNISALTVGATITVKLFQEVNGTERKVYNQSFVQGTDPDGLWIVNGTVGIHEALRVEVESNNAGDNGAAVDYDYMLEAM